VLRGTGIRVKTMAVAAGTWNMSPTEIAEDYGINEPQVREALAFYDAHRPEIDAVIAAEEAAEQAAEASRG